MTNRSFIESRTFDGFRKVVAQEFCELYVLDLGGDVRANPRLSGTKHNVFGIQTGVAISFFVKRVDSVAGKTRTFRLFYARRPEMETAEEKLAFVVNTRVSKLAYEEIRPDAKGNWLNVTSNDFEDQLPLIDKEAKASNKPSGEKAIFKLYSNGINTARDDWVTDFDADVLRDKVQFFLREYAKHGATSKDLGGVIKWSRNLKRKFTRGLS